MGTSHHTSTCTYNIISICSISENYFHLLHRMIILLANTQHLLFKKQYIEHILKYFFYKIFNQNKTINIYILIMYFNT